MQLSRKRRVQAIRRGAFTVQRVRDLQILHVGKLGGAFLRCTPRRSSTVSPFCPPLRYGLVRKLLSVPSPSGPSSHIDAGPSRRDAASLSVGWRALTDRNSKLMSFLCCLNLFSGSRLCRGIDVDCRTRRGNAFRPRLQCFRRQVSDALLNPPSSRC